MKLNLAFCRGVLLSIYAGLLCHPLVFAGAATYSPTDGDTLNTIHVLFRWAQESNANMYRLQVATMDSSQIDSTFHTGIVADVHDSSLIFILEKGLEWGNSYAWRVGAVGPGIDSTLWSRSHSFHTAELPTETPGFQAVMHDSSRFSPGLTVFDISNTSTALGINQEGRIVWFISVDPEVARYLRITNLLPNGNFLAAVYTTPSGSAYEITLDNQTVWEAPAGQESAVHHDIFPMPNGNYMAITLAEKNGPIPDGPWKEYYNIQEGDSIPWRGDVIIEWDADGNEVWKWSVFDHLNMADYDSTTFTIAIPRGFHDWTHFNAVFYDPVDQSVYLSSRQLSRIIKIDYLTGDILWMMGRVMPSGQVRVGNDLDFSWQHAIKVLENRNLILFDNGNLVNPQISRVMELSVAETDSFPIAEMVWEYVLPESLFNDQVGEADRLSNGNTLITSGAHGRILEVSADSSLIWELQMNPPPNTRNHIYRSERIPGLYPQAFCIQMPDFSIVDGHPVIHLEDGLAEIEFALSNKGWLDETYDYSLTDQTGVFQQSGSRTVAAGGSARIVLTGTISPEAGPNPVSMAVTPSRAPTLSDTIHFIVLSVATSNKDMNGALPPTYVLRPAWPNPFNSLSSIQYDLPRAGTVSLMIYDLLGTEVLELVGGYRQAGYHRAVWNGRDHQGRELPSGVYIARFMAPGYSKSVKLVLLK